MTHADAYGHVVTGASAEAVSLYEQALHEFRCYIGDPVATIEWALADSPAFVMGHAVRAYLHLLGTEPSGVAVARAAHGAARDLPMGPRERGHIAAIGHLIEGRWRAAGRVLEDVAIEQPRDALALQCGHLIDFYTGDSRMLRDRIARALPRWSAAMPGYHAVLGMYAFGLEETGHYGQAEEIGSQAVEMEPRDGWALHAVAHVMEMQGRQRDGIAWMRANPESWSQDSSFAVHNWWHLALFHLDLDEIDAVLALHDGPICGQASGVVLDMIDASALLWRLHLRGVDVGHRWQRLADRWEPLAASGYYAFNDVHAMMAFVGAGRKEATAAVIAAQERAMSDLGDNALFTREVGAPVARAIHAFGAGEYAQTVELLRPVRNIAHRFGGSHAQRDVLDLTLIEAALRDGQAALACALASERLGIKPSSLTGWRMLKRSLGAVARAA
jgi:hypothetical protein